MTDEVNDLGGFFGLDAFVKEAAETSFGPNAGVIAQGKIVFGYQVWGGSKELSKFFPIADGGKTSQEAAKAHAQVRAFAEEHQLEEWRIKRAMQVTQYAGTQLVEVPYDFSRDAVRTIVYYDVKDRGYETSFGWTSFVQSLKDAGFQDAWLGEDIWIQLRSRTHPDFSQDDDDFSDREVYREEWDSELGQGTGIYKPRYWNYVEAVFKDKETMIQHVLAQGLTLVDEIPTGGGTTASQLRGTLPANWESSAEEWEQSYDYIVNQLKEAKGPKGKVVKAAHDEWVSIPAITAELVAAIYDEINS